MAIPFVRAFDFAYGRADQVSTRIRRVIAENPGPFTFVGTGTYIVGQGEVAIIDPGPDHPRHLDALLAAIDGERVTAILLTHHHADHWPLTPALKAAVGAPVYASPIAAEAGLTPGFTPDVALAAGDQVSGPDWTLEALPTPGHASDHIAFVLNEENALFSGDHVMGWSTTVVTPPDGDMTAYYRSLDTVRARGFATLWPTHGPPVTEVAPFLDAYIAHRREREAQILAALAAGPARIADLVPRLYADVDPKLHPAAARSMLAHLIDLHHRELVQADGDLAAPTTIYRLASSATGRT